MSAAAKFLRVWSVFYLLSLLVTLAGAQTTYTFATFTVPNSTETAPFAINENGEVTGFYGVPPSGGQVGFLRLASGQITTILYPGASGSLANGINKFGVVAGTYWGTNQSALEGFFYRNGAYKNVQVNGHPAAVADINYSGYYVGQYGASQSVTAFLASPSGQVTILQYPGGYYTGPIWIKDSGEVIGTYEDQYFRLHTFLYNARAGYKTVEIRGKSGATITDINSSGMIVGGYFDGVAVRAFTYQNGNFRILPVPGATNSTASAINDKGQIVGAYTMPGTQNIGFVATPVAVPSPN
jgi:uncharacterized membrane protein